MDGESNEAASLEHRLEIVEQLTSRLAHDVITLDGKCGVLERRFEDEHEIVRRLDKSDVRDGEILHRIEGKVDQLLIVESRVRVLEMASENRRGRWWAVAGIAGLVVTVLTAAGIAVVTDWIKPRPAAVQQFDESPYRNRPPAMQPGR